MCPYANIALDTVCFQGKRVAILGNGSSGIQIVPQIQKGWFWTSHNILIEQTANKENTVAENLKCFIKGPTWISPPMPRVAMDIPEEERDTVDAAESAKNVFTSQVMYTEKEMNKLASDPEYLLKYRKQIEYGINAGFAIFYKDSEAAKGAESYMRDTMQKRLNHDPVLTKMIIPTWPVGCRRLTPGDGYLEALVQPNTECIFSDISLVDAAGIVTQDGARHDVDVIVCATGFDMAWTPHFALFGRNGVDIKKAWSPLPNCYLGIAAPGFPNYWVMNGPRGNLGNGTVLPCLETEIEFVIAAVKKMQSDRIAALDVKEDITSSLNEYIDTWCKMSVFSGSCRSWYKQNTVDGKPMVWGGSVSRPTGPLRVQIFQSM
jgi:cation diffusion facilitator CzcD-associated flavoprotein CzcO